MQYTVLLERREGGYRASVPAVPECVVEGRTREETLNKVQQSIVERLARIEITTVEIETPINFDPWEPFIGMWATDPTWNEFQAEIEAYRRQVDEEAIDV